MRFLRQEYWNGLPFSFPGTLPDPGKEAASSTLAGRFFTTEPPAKLLSSLYLCSVTSVVSDFLWPLCLTFCNPRVFSVHGILPARIQESVAMTSSRDDYSIKKLCFLSLKFFLGASSCSFKAHALHTFSYLSRSTFHQLCPSPKWQNKGCLFPGVRFSWSPI